MKKKNDENVPAEFIPVGLLNPKDYPTILVTYGGGMGGATSYFRFAHQIQHSDIQLSFTGYPICEYHENDVFARRDASYQVLHFCLKYFSRDQIERIKVFIRGGSISTAIAEANRTGENVRFISPVIVKTTMRWMIQKQG